MLGHFLSLATGPVLLPPPAKTLPRREQRPARGGLPRMFPEVDHSCRSRIIACRKMADRFRQSTVAFCQEKENSFSMMNEC